MKIVTDQHGARVDDHFHRIGSFAERAIKRVACRVCDLVELIIQSDEFTPFLGGHRPAHRIGIVAQAAFSSQFDLRENEVAETQERHAEACYGD